MFTLKRPKVISFGSCLSESIAKNINFLGVFIKRNRVDLFNKIHIKKTQKDLTISELDSIFYSLNDEKKRNNFNMILNQTKKIPSKYFFYTTIRNRVSSFIKEVKNKKIDYLILDNYNEILFGLNYISEIEKELFLNNKWFKSDMGFQYQNRISIEDILESYQVFINWIKKYQPNIKIIFLNFPFDYTKSNNIKYRVSLWRNSEEVKQFMNKNNINYIDCPTPPKNGNDLYHFESKYYRQIYIDYIKNK